MTQDIVERLRMIHEWKVGNEAADTIAALRAEVARLTAERDQGARDYCDLMDRHDAHFVAWQSAKARAEAAEAEVTRLTAERDDCAMYLKDGETPRQRMDRDHADVLSLMDMLAKAKYRAEAAQARADAAFAAGVEAAVAALEALPRRSEKLGGQTYSYVRLEEAAAAIRALAPVKGDTE